MPLPKGHKCITIPLSPEIKVRINEALDQHGLTVHEGFYPVVLKRLEELEATAGQKNAA